MLDLDGFVGVLAVEVNLLEVPVCFAFLGEAITKDRRVMIRFLARSVSAIFSNKLMLSLLSSNILINEGTLVLLQFFDFSLLDGNQSVNLNTLGI